MWGFLNKSMTKQTLSYSKTGYFSSVICDYLAQSETLKPFYHRFPSLNNFKSQIDEKRTAFSLATRTNLVAQLRQQYEGFKMSQATQNNVDALQEANTFTVTTGHQLNLFTGPLYFLYKIFSTINLAEKLTQQYPENKFVPVYWMASEDHDFEEIQYFNYEGKKVTWDREASGAVGRLSTEGLTAICQVLETHWGTSEYANYLIELFKSSYIENQSLAAATRHLANKLFKDYGLIIIDGDDNELKKEFAPYAALEIQKKQSFTAVTATSDKLAAKGYKTQVHPRELNLFYLTEGSRERIIEREGTFYINNTELSFSEEELLEEINNYPDRFSPNALLRPLYQEVILPNLCYIGGGGELAYWFQLKDYFDSVSVPFPILLLRNSVLLVPEKIQKKLNKLEISIDQFFQKEPHLSTWFTHKHSEIEIDFSKQRSHLKEQFASMYELAKQTDASFLGAVGAQEKKQLNGLDHLEKRLLKAQKRKLKESLERMRALHTELFPNGSLQERNENFSKWYLLFGNDLFDILKENLDPLEDAFTVLTV